LLPKVENSRKIKDILKEQAAGKTVDQSEISAIMSNRMVILFPVMTLFIGLYLAGALVLYLLVTSAMAIVQQTIILRQDTDELETIAAKKPSKTAAVAKKMAQATEAEVVATQPSKKKAKRRKS
jgi:membrane protein insertase Oxa1/YidC/SpoIIIJ